MFSSRFWTYCSQNMSNSRRLLPPIYTTTSNQQCFYLEGDDVQAGSSSAGNGGDRLSTVQNPYEESILANCVSGTSVQPHENTISAYYYYNNFYYNNQVANRYYNHQQNSYYSSFNRSTNKRQGKKSHYEQLTYKEQIEGKAARQWEFTNDGRKKQTYDGHVFKVLSYNVLSQDLLDKHPEIYKKHTKTFLRWRTRWENLYNEICQHNADILCLQEVQQNHYKYYTELNELGYNSVYKRRTGNSPDGCAIFYKRDAFILKEYVTVEYNQPDAHLLDRDNIGIIATMAPVKAPHKEFVVATTHLLYNPKREDVRTAQMQMLLTEIDRIAYSNSEKRYVPIILTGDFNSEPDSKVLRLITDGQLDYSDLLPTANRKSAMFRRNSKGWIPSTLGVTNTCQHVSVMKVRANSEEISTDEENMIIHTYHSEKRLANLRYETEDETMFASGNLTHKFQFHSVYEDNTVATTYQNKWIVVDYIFYDKGKNNQLKLLALYQLPKQQELDNVNIPNADLGSDHISLLAFFKLDC